MCLQFIEFTNAPLQYSIQCLDKANWYPFLSRNLQNATNTYFESDHSDMVSEEEPKAQLPKNSEKEVDMISKYILKDAPNKIDCVSFFTDMFKDFNDQGLIAFVYHCEAKVSGEISKEELIKGLKYINSKSMDEVKNAISSLRNEMSLFDTFLPIYEFTFAYNIMPPKKFILTEDAVPLYEMLLNASICKFKTEWLAFLKSGIRKDIVKDGWNTFGEFLRDIEGDLKKVNADAYYHTMIDEFLAFVKKGCKKE